MRRIGQVAVLVGLSMMTCPVFVDQAGATVGRGIEFPLGPGMYASALTLGPDGNLWFAGTRYRDAGATDVVGRMTPGGQIAEFPLPPRPDSELGISSIVAGPDGNLYFTEPNGDKTGQVSPAGRIVEAPLPVPGSKPRTIATAPDGSLWITEEGTDRVARIDLAEGVLRERWLEPGARPTGIAARADGTIWIAEPGLDRVATMPATAKGPMISFRIPFADSRPNAILSGPEGDVWFTEEAGPWLGRFTSVAGTKAEYQRLGPSPLTQGTRWLAFGPNGDFWFTSGHRIGSISANLLLGEMACVRGGCGLPVNALAVSQEGDLWYATGAREAEAADASSRAGTIGRFRPPRISAAIDRHAGRLAGRYVKVGVSCRGGAAGQLCNGRVRIVSHGSGEAPAVLGSRGLAIHVQSNRHFRIRLSRAAARLLRREGRLPVRVTVRLASGGRAARRIVLRAGGKARGPARG
jgi:streptogramin lyase